MDVEVGLEVEVSEECMPLTQHHDCVSVDGVFRGNCQTETELGQEIPSLECLTPTVRYGGSPTKGVQHLKSPLKTIETVETIVSTNKVTVYSSVEEPRVGMVFKKWEDVEAYYKEYGEQRGFGVTRVASTSSKLTNERTGATWKCECWGPPDMRARREARKRGKCMDVCGTGGAVNGIIGEDELSRGKRTSKKCFCEAKIYASVNGDGEWVLRTVVLTHTHKYSPSKSKLVKEYRMKKYTSTVAKRLLDFYDEGVPVSQIHGCLASEQGGVDNLPSVKDLEHEVYKARRLKMQGGDAAAMMAYFDCMQADNQKFFHAHRLDEEGRLKDVCWVDARSRVAYEQFHDVVCFDATYLTNEYELPFANFVGVNHHGQSTLLGCALVSHETSETYVWVFKQWLACMGNVPPGSILTDQAAAMRKAVASVIPTSRHRWCIWHTEKLGKCHKYMEFKSPLKNLIYESLTVEEFEARWISLIKKYKLQDNKWLSNLFEERHMWVPSFMKEHFWAGMKTTQRVESINSFFDGFVNRTTKLHEFPEKYTRAMAKRVKAELDADARCSKYVRRLVSGIKAEAFFQKIYTDAKFQEVQAQCARMLYCYGKETVVVDDNVTKYVLEDRVWLVPEGGSEEKITDRRRVVSVLYNKSTKDLSCDCRKFETSGILCNHAIHVFDMNLVFDIPDKYVLDRWRKDVVRMHTRVKVAYHDPSATIQVKYYQKMMTEFQGICEQASAVDDVGTLELVMKTLSQLRIDVQLSREKYFESVQTSTDIPSLSEIGSNLLQHSDDTAQDEAADVDHGPGFMQQAEGVPGVSLMQLNEDPMQLTSHQLQTMLAVPAEHTPGLNADPSPGLNAETSHGPYVVSQVKDPVPRKRRRGRPKVTRHKTLGEVGYNKAKKGKKSSSTTAGVMVDGIATTVKRRRRGRRTAQIEEEEEGQWEEEYVEDIYSSDPSKIF